MFCDSVDSREFGDLCDFAIFMILNISMMWELFVMLEMFVFCL